MPSEIYIRKSHCNSHSTERVNNVIQTIDTNNVIGTSSTNIPNPIQETYKNISIHIEVIVYVIKRQPMQLPLTRGKEAYRPILSMRYVLRAPRYPFRGHAYRPGDMWIIVAILRY